jgi:predicted AAA+ superfamily ATPase
MVFDRRLTLDRRRSYLLLGPRRTGKSTFLRQSLPDAEYIDLLKSDVYFEYRMRPSLLRERYGRANGTIIIDEVQRIPELLNEVHWLLENSRARFVLCGSSARKLRRQGVTNLAGRLKSARMVPLTIAEMPDFDLGKQLQHGCLPPIVLSDTPDDDLRDYCGEYLREEVQSEGLIRSIPSFSRFLEAAALSNAELVSYAPIARDCGVSPKTVAAYFQILEDTLLGFFLMPFTRTRKRRAILSPKFYFFDCGLPNSLLGRRLSPRTPEFGKSFEQFLVLETIAAMFYDRTINGVTYWRSASGFEVDLLIDTHTAVEFKSGNVHEQDCAGLLALGEELKLKNRWIVSTEPRARMLANGIEVLPWKMYVARLKRLPA